ncbi:hypothetical protein ACEWY4_010935 [Coilia grayii]|uniref:Uncharacterized protein n=1 Tax=Coilia grayii TaxID=363190 RepID=A0ABD1K3B2_9TELE
MNQKMPQGSPELSQAPMQMPQAPANVPPAPVSQAQAEMMPPQAQMPPAQSNLAWRFDGFSGGFLPPVNQKMPQHLLEVPQAPVQMPPAPVNQAQAEMPPPQAQMPPAQAAPSNLAWQFGGFSSSFKPSVNQNMPQGPPQMAQVPVQKPPMPQAPAKEPLAPVSQDLANMPPAQAAPSNLAWRFGGFSGGFAPPVNQKMPQGPPQMPQAPVQKPPMPQAPATEPLAPVSQDQAEMPPPQAQMPPAQAAPSNPAWQFRGFSSGFAPPVNQNMPQGPPQMAQVPVQKPPMPHAPAKEPLAPVSQDLANMPPAQAAPSNLAWRFGGFSGGFAPPVNQKMPQGPPQMPQAPVQKPPMPQAPATEPLAPVSQDQAEMPPPQAQMLPAQAAPSNPAWQFRGFSSGFAPPVNQNMPKGPPQALVQKPPRPQAPMRRPQAPANVPPAPVSQAQAQMPPAQPAPSHPAGGDLGSSSVNGVGEAAFTDGDSESPTPEQARYLVLTAPSGFQTRYVVKSFNRYVRGKRVFSQTTYIPLDIPPPPPPSAPIDQPAPVSNPGHEAQTVEVTPAK